MPTRYLAICSSEHHIFSSAFTNHDLNFERPIMALIKIALWPFVLMTSGWPRIISAFCNLGYTNSPLDGFYCDGQSNKPPYGVTQASCVHSCIRSSSCTTMSYNPVISVCLLAKQSCVKAEKNASC